MLMVTSWTSPIYSHDSPSPSCNHLKVDSWTPLALTAVSWVTLPAGTPVLGPLQGWG